MWGDSLRACTSRYVRPFHQPEYHALPINNLTRLIWSSASSCWMSQQRLLPSSQWLPIWKIWSLIPTQAVHTQSRESRLQSFPHNRTGKKRLSEEVNSPNYATYREPP